MTLIQIRDDEEPEKAIDLLLQTMIEHAVPGSRYCGLQRDGCKTPLVLFNPPLFRTTCCLPLDSTFGTDAIRLKVREKQAEFLSTADADTLRKSLSRLTQIASGLRNQTPRLLWGLDEIEREIDAVRFAIREKQEPRGNAA